MASMSRTRPMRGTPISPISIAEEVQGWDFKRGPLEQSTVCVPKGSKQSFSRQLDSPSRMSSVPTISPRDKFPNVAFEADETLIQYALDGLKRLSSPSSLDQVSRTRERSLKQLRNLAIKSAANRETLLDAGAISLVVETLLGHSESFSVIDHACWFLSDLVEGNSPAKWELCDSGLPLLLRNSLTARKRNVAPIMHLLGILAQDEPQILDSSLQNSAVSSSLGALTSNSAEDCREALFCLASIVAPNECVRSEVLASGGLRLLLSTLAQEDIPPALALQGLITLRVMLSKSMDACEEAGDRRAVETIVGLMRIHKMSVEIMNECCLLMMDLSTSQENRFRIGEHGGIDAILLGTEVHKHYPLFVCNALASLRRVIIESAQNQGLAGSKGTVELTVCIMRLYQDNSDIQEVSCGVFREMTGWISRAGNATLRSELIEAVLRALQFHLPSRGVQENACATLVDLIQLGVGGVAESRAEMLVDRCLDEYSEDPVVRTLGLKLMNSIQELRSTSVPVSPTPDKPIRNGVVRLLSIGRSSIIAPNE
mmetsp:Transcript_16570/g.33925  ORF Transcript_16570/g.33925 Transcript_16570/m.33925 type:complete len:542 (-) Transcript_16570:1124-2749(-)